MEWLSVNQWTPNVSRDNWFNVTYRQVMQAVEIDASGNKVRFTFRAGNTRGLRVGACFVGKVFGTDPTGAAFLEEPTKVTFGGSDGFTLAAGASIVSDEIAFDYDSADGDALVVSWFVPIDIHVNGSGFGRVSVPGTSLHWVKGNYAEAMLSEMDGNIFYYHEFAAISVVKTELFSNDAPGDKISRTFEFNYELEAVEPALAEVSKFSAYSVTTIGDLSEVSKFSIFAVTTVGDLSEVSKLSLYAIVDKTIAIDFPFNYYIGDIEPVIVDYEFDYRMDELDITYPFDYRIFGSISKDFTFNYEIGSQPIFRDYEFDYGITDTITKTFEFDYWLAIEPTRPIQAEYRFDYVLERNRVPFALVPETPVVETYAFMTAKAISYDGTEQRAALRGIPFTTLEYTYVLDHDDRQVALEQLLNNIRGEFFVPSFPHATRILQPMSAGNTTIYLNNDRTDIRVGDTVFVITSNGEGSGTAVCNAVGSGFVTVEGGVPIDLPPNSWAMPARAASIADGSGVSMLSMSGEGTLTFGCLDRRPVIRPSAPGGLLPTFDGMPLLDKRPLANDEVEEAVSANVTKVQVPDASPALFPTWRMPRVEGERIFLLRRPEDMDYWREFVAMTTGQRKSFLAPTFRPDLSPLSVGSGGTVLTVLGRLAQSLFGFDAYTRLRIETDAGTVYRKISSVTAPTGNTELTLTEALPSNTVNRISYVNRVRLATDEIRFEHDEMHSFVSFSLRTVNE